MDCHNPGELTPIFLRRRGLMLPYMQCGVWDMTILRSLGIAGMLFVGLFVSGAQAFETPRQLIDAIYAPYQSGKVHDSLQPFYSERLQGLFVEHAARSADVEPVALSKADTPSATDFNPFLDADYPLLFDVKVSEPAELGDYAIATVAFHNFDHPSLLSIAMVREADGWKVDDVTSTGEGENWMLSWLLRFDPWNVK